MRTSEILADFSNGGSVVQTDPVYQYDKRIKLRIKGTGITSLCEVHFANRCTDEGSYVIMAEVEGEDLVVTIPDEVMEAETAVYTYLYYGDDQAEFTAYRIVTPILLRAKPDGYTPTPSEKSAFKQALEAVEDARESIKEAEKAIDDCVLSAQITTIEGGHHLTVVDKNGRHEADILDGLTGDQGPAGPAGPTGRDGISPTITVTAVEGGYHIAISDAGGGAEFTIYNGTDGTNGTDGADGRDGRDGISPIITITEGTGEHTLSVVDTTGTHSTTIHDGQDGATGPAGSDGVSPTVSVVDGAGTHTVTITDKDGAHTTVINDGDDYVLTAQDKADIAAIVAQQIGSADTTAY